MDDTKREFMVKTVARARRRKEPREDVLRMLMRQVGLPINKAEEAYAAIRNGLQRGDGCLYRGLSPPEEIEKINSKLGRLAFQHALKAQVRRRRRLKILAVVVGAVILLGILALNLLGWLRPLLGLGDR